MSSRPRHLCSLLVVLALSACAAPQPLPRRALAPAPSPISAAPVKIPNRVRAEAFERAAPAVAPRAGQWASPAPNPARPAAPTHRSFVERVEVPVERVVEVAPALQRYDDYDDYLARRRAGRRRDPNPFPVNTTFGAGVGAILGHQSGRRDEGALIGAGLGLVFDLARWSR